MIRWTAGVVDAAIPRSRSKRPIVALKGMATDESLSIAIHLTTSIVSTKSGNPLRSFRQRAAIVSPWILRVKVEYRCRRRRGPTITDWIRATGSIEDGATDYLEVARSQWSASVALLARSRRRKGQFSAVVHSTSGARIFPTFTRHLFVNPSELKRLPSNSDESHPL